MSRQELFGYVEGTRVIGDKEYFVIENDRGISKNHYSNYLVDWDKFADFESLKKDTPVWMDCEILKELEVNEVIIEINEGGVMDYDY